MAFLPNACMCHSLLLSCSELYTGLFISDIILDFVVEIVHYSCLSSPGFSPISAAAATFSPSHKGLV